MHTVCAYCARFQQFCFFVGFVLVFFTELEHATACKV